MQKFIHKNNTQNLRENILDDVCYLTIPAFEETHCVNHLFSTRIGGVSEGIYSSMNVSYSRGDKKEAVDENYRRLAKILDSKVEQFVFSKQTHTTNLRVVTKEDMGKGTIRPIDYDDVDGLITNIPGIVLATFYADCVPLLFLDPIKKVIAASHSGWRGTVEKIGMKTVETMVELFQCNPNDILVAIGPSICKDCYEVSRDVFEEFSVAFKEEALEKIFEEKKNNKFQLNLWKANEILLKDAGILATNITVTDICTCCNNELLFSHRATNGKRGNIGAFICLK